MLAPGSSNMLILRRNSFFKTLPKVAPHERAKDLMGDLMQICSSYLMADKDATLQASGPCLFLPYSQQTTHHAFN
jgi:hypothetical protein